MKSLARAFTLVELLVVVAIIAILAGVVLYNVPEWLRHGKMMGTRAEISGLELALESYRSDLGSYPPRALWIDALEKGLGASVKWHGPYFSFENGRLAQIDQSGRVVGSKTSPLVIYNGDEAGSMIFSVAQRAYLDFFNRPYIYIPHTAYNQVQWPIRSENDPSYAHYNPTSFQLISAGFDGTLLLKGDGSIAFQSYFDNRDNDGDNLIDRADGITGDSPPYEYLITN